MYIYLYIFYIYLTLTLSTLSGHAGPGERHSWHRSIATLDAMALADSSVMEVLANIGEYWEADHTAMRHQGSISWAL